MRHRVSLIVVGISLGCGVVGSIAYLYFSPSSRSAYIENDMQTAAEIWVTGVNRPGRPLVAREVADLKSLFVSSNLVPLPFDEADPREWAYVGTVRMGKRPYGDRKIDVDSAGRVYTRGEYFSLKCGDDRVLEVLHDSL